MLHVPFHEVSQHAQKDVADDSWGPVVVDGSYFEVHGLEAPEGLLYSAEPLVIASSAVGSLRLLRMAYMPSRDASLAMESALRW